MFDPSEGWRDELWRRFSEQNKLGTTPAPMAGRRKVGDLLATARARALERTERLAAQREKEAAERKAKEEVERARYLDQLAKHQETVWQQVSAHIQTRRPKEYEKAVKLLIDLHDLAIRRGSESEFRAAMEDLRKKHAAKGSFLHLLTRVNL